MTGSEQDMAKSRWRHSATRTEHGRLKKRLAAVGETLQVQLWRIIGMLFVAGVSAQSCCTRFPVTCTVLREPT